MQGTVVRRSVFCVIDQNKLPTTEGFRSYSIQSCQSVSYSANNFCLATSEHLEDGQGNLPSRQISSGRDNDMKNLLLRENER